MCLCDRDKFCSVKINVRLIPYVENMYYFVISLRTYTAH